MRTIKGIDGKEVIESKGIEITHILSEKGGWVKVDTSDLGEKEVLTYLGHCEQDGDMFMGKHEENIFIYKGHLNNGTY